MIGLDGIEWTFEVDGIVYDWLDGSSQVHQQPMVKVVVEHYGHCPCLADESAHSGYSRSWGGEGGRTSFMRMSQSEGDY